MGLATVLICCLYGCTVSYVRMVRFHVLAACWLHTGESISEAVDTRPADKRGRRGGREALFIYFGRYYCMVLSLGSQIWPGLQYLQIEARRDSRDTIYVVERLNSLRILVSPIHRPRLLLPDPTQPCPILSQERRYTPTIVTGVVNRAYILQIL